MGRGEKLSEEEKQIQENKKELLLREEQIKEEKANRNYFQLERDKINAFLEITKRECETIRSEIRNKEREMEEQEERHQVELKVYKQKVRHLLYEQKIAQDRLKIESENALKLQADEYRQKIQQFKNDRRNLKQDISTLELAQDEALRMLSLNNDKKITRLREEFERKMREVQVKYETKMNNLREELELKSKKDSEEIEDKKNQFIKDLMAKHTQAFRDIKAYYHVITTNNLVNISNLKDEVNKMKRTEANNEKLMFEIAQENKKLSEPLSNALAEIDQLRKEHASHQKDKLSLNNAKARLIQLETQVKELKWEHEIVEQSFKQVQSERDELYKKFEKSVYDMQQRSLLKNQLLETKISALEKEVEKKDAQIKEVLRHSKLDEQVLADIAPNPESEQDQKVEAINNLQSELLKWKKAYNTLLSRIHRHMTENNIPEDETTKFHYIN